MQKVKRDKSQMEETKVEMYISQNVKKSKVKRTKSQKGEKYMNIGNRCLCTEDHDVEDLF